MTETMGTSEKCMFSKKIENNPGIGEFYRNANVLITGASGFVGKALLEKLLRSCEHVDTVYLLIRPKKGVSVDERLRQILRSEVFSALFEKSAEIFNKVKAVPGDVTLPRLGLNEANIEMLRDTANVVFHSAASIK